MKTMHWLKTTLGGAPAVAVVFAGSLALASCDDLTAPASVEQTPEETPSSSALEYPLPPVQSTYSLSPANLMSLESEEVTQWTSGNRWCNTSTVWFDPTAVSCDGARAWPPYGEVVMADGDVRLLADRYHAAPFIWTGPPGGVNPFPESGDFTVEFRVQFEQLGILFTGVAILDWNPAETVGESNPFAQRTMQIYGRSRDGVRATVAGHTVFIDEPLAPHSYRLVHEQGAYTLYVDDVQAIGPVESDIRPTALWLGYPGFTRWPADWSDLRVSQVTVSTPAAAVAQVPVDVKPGSCPSPVNPKARGVVPVLILGTEDLDVSQIDVSTLRLGSARPAREKFVLQDVAAPAAAGDTQGCSVQGPDGFMDMKVMFTNEEVGDAIARSGEPVEGEQRTLTLTGNLLPDFDGTPISGEDLVVIRNH